MVLVALLLAFVPAVVLAAIVAAILNLPIPAAAQFLCFVLLWWGYVVVKGLADLTEALGRIGMWTRLGFLATELQNEREGHLGRSFARMEEDDRLVAKQRDIASFGEVRSGMVMLGAGFFAVILAGLLYFGVFGSVGSGTMQWLVERTFG